MVINCISDKMKDTASYTCNLGHCSMDVVNGSWASFILPVKGCMCQQCTA